MRIFHVSDDTNHTVTVWLLFFWAILRRIYNLAIWISSLYSPSLSWIKPKMSKKCNYKSSKKNLADDPNPYGTQRETPDCTFGHPKQSNAMAPTARQDTFTQNPNPAHKNTELSQDMTSEQKFYAMKPVSLLRFGLIFKTFVHPRENNTREGIPHSCWYLFDFINIETGFEQGLVSM